MKCFLAVAAAAKLLQSGPTLCYPIDGSLPGSPVPGILQARLLEWVAIFFSNAWKWEVKVKLLNHVQPLRNPIDCNWLGSSVHGIFQARVLEWVAIAFSNVPLVSLILLKRSLVFPFLLFSSISLHWSLRKAFLSLLAILRNSAFKWEYLSFSPLLFAFLLFTAICKASSDCHFAFLHYLFLGIVLILVSCTMLWTFIHSSSGTLSDLVP